MPWKAAQACLAGGVRARSLRYFAFTLNPKTLVGAQIIPVENIQGRKAVESGDACLRKTSAGVDLNRNWAHAWRQVLTCLQN